jgi:hypothetical protein
MMLLLILLFGATIASSARADDPPEIAVTFFGDRFEPVDIVVPIGLKFALKVTNKTSAAMEWESIPLRREKIVPAGSTATIYIGPLRAGSYEYFDDFHPTVRGHVVAR